MDELEISGKRYLSTRRAAREHGYHSDYMGQLIRGKKVAGQKVGRAWYIEEESLAAYLGKPLPAAPTKEALPTEAGATVPVQAPAPVAPEYVEPIKVVEPVLQPVEPIQNVEPPAPQIAEEEKSTRIPIHIPASAIQEIGGLRYAADDSPALPTLPIVTRMPQAPQYAPYQHPVGRPAGERTHSRFPIVSLSVVGALALLAALFAANFISATVVSQPGKSASVQYAIHW